jgi:hypothetical protein
LGVVQHIRLLRNDFFLLGLDIFHVYRSKRIKILLS